MQRIFNANKHTMKTFLVVTAVVLIAGFFLYYIIKEMIKTYKNKPYDPEQKQKLKQDDRL